MFDVAEGGWKTGTLGQYLDRAAGGGTPARDNPEFWGGSIPWVSVKDITKGRELPQETITPEGLSNSSSRLIAAGTNIIATRMAVGSVMRYDVDVAINQDLLALTPSAQLDPDFLYHWLNLNAEKFLAVATGTTVKGIRKDLLLSFSMDVPPLDEQRRIAEVLGSVDEAITSQSALCVQLAVMFSSLTEACFTVGENAEGRWPILPLDELCESIQVGIVVRPASYYVESGGIPALRSLNVGENRLDLGNLVYISIEGHRQNNKSSLRAGDVVTRRTGEPGKTAVIPAQFPDGLNCIDIIFSRPKAKLRSEFLAFFMNSDAAKRQVLGLQGGLAQQHLNVGEMKTIKVPVPEIAIQDEEIATLKATLERLETEKALLRRLSSLKTALASDLLSGRVRVPA